MPSYTIKVPNSDEGEDLGEYESDYLPSVGHEIILWHPRVCPDDRTPFLGVVEAVTHEAHDAEPSLPGRSRVDVTVWVVEQHAPVKIYCDCSKEKCAAFGVDANGDCENCGHTRRR
jgi:hypothetical protein